MTKPVCIVTGANTGIGKATARALAQRGHHVFVACRSEEKGQAAIAEIRAAVPDATVAFLSLDLGSLASVRRAAESFLSQDLPLPLLINNAGVAGQRGETADGFELQFGTNHMGHFLFTTLLLERIKRSGPARIVNVASKAHYDAPGIDWERVRGRTRTITGLPEYSVSKLANILFSAELGRRLAGTDVTTYALHPGVVKSDAWRRIPWPIRQIVTRNMISNEEGAETTLHCATSPSAAAETGLYYDRSRAKEPSAPAKDTALARELWEKSERWAT